VGHKEQGLLVGQGVDGLQVDGEGHKGEGEQVVIGEHGGLIGQD